MSRKTINLEILVRFANQQLARVDSFITREQRLGVITMVEEALRMADAYKGFQYLTNDQLPVSVLPGVRYENGNILPFPQRFENTDDSRRYYFV